MTVHLVPTHKKSGADYDGNSKPDHQPYTCSGSLAKGGDGIFVENGSYPRQAGGHLRVKVDQDKIDSRG